MNTLQIECFLSVSRNRSFSGAARERYISQPSISKHIRNMEEELGVILFDRDYQSISLTPAGELYYKFFTDFMEGLHEMRVQTHQYSESSQGSVHLGLLYGWHLPEPLSAAIEDFQRNFPNVTITVENHGFRELISLLNRGTLDACIHLQDFLDSMDNLKIVSLLDIPKYLVYSPRLAPKEKSLPEVIDFRNCVYYCVEEQSRSPVANQMIRYCNYYGFSPRIVPQPNIESVVSNVLLGNGVTILDGFTRIENSQNLRLLELNPPHRASLAWLKTSSNKLLNLLADEFSGYFQRQKES